MSTNIFFTSDHHFYHGNVIKYCNRPFSDVEEMNQVMIERWNRTIGKEDIVYHLGDFCMSSSISKWKDLINSLNGNVILIEGNHDNKSHKGKMSRYLKIGFSAVYQFTEISLAGQKVILSHYPYFKSFEERYAWRRLVDCGHALLHGHIHEKGHGGVNQINVGVDIWDFYPVPQETIIDKLTNL